MAGTDTDGGSRVSRVEVLRVAAPWLWIPMTLWLLQVWAVLASDFTMEVTLLQLPLVLVFEVFIVVFAYHHVKETVRIP